MREREINGDTHMEREDTTATMGDAAAKPPGPGPSHWCDFMRPWSGHAAGSAAPIGHNSPHCWWGHPRALPCKRKQETFDSSAALFGQLAPHCWWNHLLVLPCKRKHSIINTASQCPGAVKSPQANAGWRPPPSSWGEATGPSVALAWPTHARRKPYPPGGIAA